MCHHLNSMSGRKSCMKYSCAPHVQHRSQRSPPRTDQLSFRMALSGSIEPGPTRYAGRKRPGSGSTCTVAGRLTYVRVYPQQRFRASTRERSKSDSHFRNIGRVRRPRDIFYVLVEEGGNRRTNHLSAITGGAGRHRLPKTRFGMPMGKATPTLI